MEFWPHEKDWYRIDQYSTPKELKLYFNLRGILKFMNGRMMKLGHLRHMAVISYQRRMFININANFNST